MCMRALNEFLDLNVSDAGASGPQKFVNSSRLANMKPLI